MPAAAGGSSPDRVKGKGIQTIPTKRHDAAKPGRAHRPGVALLGDLSAAHPIRREAAAPAQVGARPVARRYRLLLVGAGRAPVPAGRRRAPRTAHVRPNAAAARRAALRTQPLRGHARRAPPERGAGAAHPPRLVVPRPIDWAGETQDYVDRVFRVAELVGQGLRPPPEQQRACAYAQCLVDQHMSLEEESEEESDEEL